MKETILKLKHRELHPLPFNRPDRSGFDKKSIGDLGKSIKEQGIVQPLVVRERKAGGYDIICGERRWTAAGEVGFNEIPCVLRQATDAQARELNLIENLQREGIHELEEARGYQEMLQLLEEGKPACVAGANSARPGDNDTSAGRRPVHTIKTIAEKIGKSEAYVYARVKLLAMPEVAQEAFLSGKMNASVALLICRIPDPKMAHKATLQVLDRYGSGFTEERAKRALDPECEPMSYRNAKDLISTTYMIRLKGAPFDQEDATLVPLEETKVTADQAKQNGPLPTVERLAGGKCSDCPFRTGNMSRLAPDLFKTNSADVCTHTACYQRKVKAHEKREAERFAKKGQTLLPKGKADRLLNWEKTELSTGARSEYLDLREKVPGKKKTWEEALDGHLPEDADIFVARGKKNHLLLPMESALAAAKKAGIKLEKPKASSNSYDPEVRKREEAERKARHDLAEKVIAEADPLLRAAIQSPKNAAAVRLQAGLAALNRTMIDDDKESKALEKRIDKMTDPELFAAILDCHVPEHPVGWQGAIDDGYLHLCNALGIDLQPIADKHQPKAEKPDEKKEEAKK